MATTRTKKTARANRKPKIKYVPLDLIRIDGETQSRVELSEETVAEYKELLVGEFEFPPIIVYFDGIAYWLADGFHRFFAHTQAHFDKINCEVRQGTQLDAQWVACGSNKTHGLRRSNADKQRAVEMALKHPRGAQSSDSAIADHVGVAPNTVKAHRERLEATSQIAKCDVREGRDGHKRSTGSEKRSNAQRREQSEAISEQSAPLETPVETPVASPAAEQPIEQAVDQTPEQATATVSVDPPIENADDNQPSEPQQAAHRGVKSLSKLYEDFDDMLGKLVRCIDDIANAGGGADKFTNKAHQALNLVKSNVVDHKRAHC